VKSKININRVSLSAMFLLGSAVLFIPISHAKEGDLVPFVVSFAVSLGFYFLWSFLADRFYKTSKENIYGKVAAPVIIGVCLAAEIITTRNFVSYIFNDVLVENTKISVLSVFASIVFFVVLKGEKPLSKFSVLALVFCFLSIIVLFFASVDNFSSGNVKSLFAGNTEDFLINSGRYFVRVFLCPLVFAFYSRRSFNEENKKSDFLGFFIGFLMLSLCYLNAGLIFSLPYAARLDFAYPLSISVVSVGNLFTRMDGFAYFIIFFSCLIKTAVSGITIGQIIKSFGIKHSKLITAFCVLAGASIGYIV